MKAHKTVNAHFSYVARPWQQQFHIGARGKRFAQVIAGRQIGKTELSLNELVNRSLSDTGQSCFAYVSPYLAQSRKIFWPRLKKFLAPIAKYCTVKEAEMSVLLPNGSMIYCLGADNDAARGLSLRGIIADEFDGIPKDIWSSVYLPAQASFGDDAWIIFIGTIGYGHSKLYGQHEKKKDDPVWYTQITRADETGLLTIDQLDRLRLEMGNSVFMREMLCDPHAPSERAILGDLLVQADLQGRIGSMPINPLKPVITSFDLGIRDATSVWFAQLSGRYIDLIAYREYEGMGLDSILRSITTEFQLQWGDVILPGDVANREGRSGATRLDLFYDMHFGQPVNIGKPAIADTLASTRINLTRCRFNTNECRLGLSRLQQAEYVVDERTDTTLNKIRHDDASHCLDSFRYLMHWLELENPTASGEQFGNGFIRKHRVLRSV